MQIVTGYTGAAHVTSNAAQGFNQGVFGGGNYVLNVGHKFNATMANTTSVTLEDGEGVMQGVHFRIEPGTTETVNITSGTSGYNRIDLICARYTKDASTGVENVELVVITGTPAAGDASRPDYVQGDILAGDTLAEFPLWWVIHTGLTPTLYRSGEIYHNTGSILNTDIDLCDTEQTYVSDTLKPGAYIIRVECSTLQTGVVDINYLIGIYPPGDNSDPIWEKYGTSDFENATYRNITFPAFIEPSDENNVVRIQAQSFSSNESIGKGKAGFMVYASRIM